jgi:hypothetical protein
MEKISLINIALTIPKPISKGMIKLLPIHSLHGLGVFYAIILVAIVEDGKGLFGLPVMLFQRHELFSLSSPWSRTKLVPIHK